MRVLLVEDDFIFGDGLKNALELRGHTVDWLTDGNEARGALAHDGFEGVILDLALPGRSGMDLLADWRVAGRDTPVLVLTASGGETLCVEALDSGADDYVTKPVDLDQLAARLKALGRRHGGRSDNRLKVGNLTLDQGAGTAWLGDAPLALSAFELRILRLLMERAGGIVTRDQLEDNLYGWDVMPESNSVQVMIHKLRGKIGAKRITTVRGLGYRLDH